MTKKDKQSKKRWPISETNAGRHVPVNVLGTPMHFYGFPRNNFDYEGGIVVYFPGTSQFLRVFWGVGDNLTREDTKKGYDDYIIYDCYGHTGKRPLSEIMQRIRDNDGYLDTVSENDEGCLAECDGGMLLVKRKKKKSGDIRDYILDVMEMCGMCREDSLDALHVYTE